MKIFYCEDCEQKIGLFGREKDTPSLPCPCGGTKHPLIGKTDEGADVPLHCGVISPDSLRMGVYALMCMVEAVIGQYDSSGGINCHDWRDMKDQHGKMKKALKEMGL